MSPDLLSFTKVRELPFPTIRTFSALGSTNDHALGLVRNSDVLCPVLIVTQEQTSGRGRRQNQWWSSRQSLTFSIVFKREAFAADRNNAQAVLQESEQDRIGVSSQLIPLLVAQTICQTIEELELALKVPVQIKWPNDLLLGGEKFAGILVESVFNSNARYFVIGIGINVNQSLADKQVQSKLIPVHSFTSLKASTVECLAIDQTQLLVNLCLKLQKAFLISPPTDRQLVAQVNRNLAYLNEKVALGVPSGENVEGVLLGIDQKGGVILREGQKSNVERPFYSGTLRRVLN